MVGQRKVTCWTSWNCAQASTDCRGENAVVEAPLLVEGRTYTVRSSVNVPVKVRCVRRDTVRRAAGEDESERVSDNQGMAYQTQSPASISKTAALSSADRRVEKIAETVELSVA